MAGIQKRLCPQCGQANDYENQTCSFCASSLDEERDEDQAQTTRQETGETTAFAQVGPRQSGITKKELQAIAAQERSQMPFTDLEKKNRRFFLIAVFIVPLVFLVLAAVFGVLASLSEVWRVSR